MKYNLSFCYDNIKMGLNTGDHMKKEVGWANTVQSVLDEKKRKERRWSLFLYYTNAGVWKL